MADVKEFRKKPVVIQAIQWDGTLSGMDEILSVFTDIRTVAKTSHPPTNTCSFWKIGTLEGSHEVSAHDFVIRGVKGEYYQCKPDIFFMTYEPATTTPPPDAALAELALYLDRMADRVRTDVMDCARLRQAAAALRARAVPEAVAKYRHHLALLRDDCTYPAGHVGAVVLNGHRMEIIRDALSAILSATDSEVKK